MKSSTKLVAIPLCIRFNEVDGFIRVYDGSKYFVLFGFEKYDAINKKITYLMSQKCGITYFFSQAFGKNEIDSDDDLPQEKPMTLNNVVIHMKSILNKDPNRY